MCRIALDHIANQHFRLLDSVQYTVVAAVRSILACEIGIGRENIHHAHRQIQLFLGWLSSGHVKLQSPLLELLVFCFQMFLLF